MARLRTFMFHGDILHPVTVKVRAKTLAAAKKMAEDEEFVEGMEIYDKDDSPRSSAFRWNEQPPEEIKPKKEKSNGSK